MKFRWKSPTQIMKVADTNHLDMSRCLRQSPWQVRDKPICVALMEFSPLQCTRKVGDKVRGLCRGHKSRKSATQIMKVGDVIFVAGFHDLCPRHVRNFVGNLSRTLSQSQRNGIWALGPNWEQPNLEWLWAQQRECAILCVFFFCFTCREISETQAAMRSVEDSKSQLLLTTAELQLKLEACICIRRFDDCLLLLLLAKIPHFLTGRN